MAKANSKGSIIKISYDHLHPENWKPYQFCHQLLTGERL